MLYDINISGFMQGCNIKYKRADHTIYVQSTLYNLSYVYFSAKSH